MRNWDGSKLMFACLQEGQENCSPSHVKEFSAPKNQAEPFRVSTFSTSCIACSFCFGWGSRDKTLISIPLGGATKSARIGSRRLIMRVTMLLAPCKWAMVYHIERLRCTRDERTMELSRVQIFQVHWLMQLRFMTRSIPIWFTLLYSTYLALRRYMS